MLIRSMSPRVIAVDEIGDYEDIRAIEAVLNCGCRILATVHGNSIEDIEKKAASETVSHRKNLSALCDSGKPGGCRESERHF